jgi:hypothetical protein
MDLTPEQIASLVSSLTPVLVEALTPAIAPLIDQKNASLAQAIDRKLAKFAQPTPELKEAPVRATQDATESKSESKASSGDSSGADREEAKSQRLTLAALQKNIEDLKLELVNRDASALNARRAAAIAQAVADVPNLLQPKLLQRLIRDDYSGGMKLENDSFFYEDPTGAVTSIADVVKNYLASETGQLFVAPTGANGAGSSESKGGVSGGERELTLAEKYAQLGS